MSRAIMSGGVFVSSDPVWEKSAASQSSARQDGLTILFRNDDFLRIYT